MLSNVSNKKIITISSKFDPVNNLISTHDFTTRLGLQYSNYKKCSLLYAELPKSYYMFDNRSDAEIHVIEDNGVLAKSYTTDIEINRNYTTAELMTEIISEINVDSVNHGYSDTYTMAFTTTMNSFIIYSSSGNTITLSCNPGSPMYKYLGFRTSTVVFTFLYNFAQANLQRYNSLNCNFSIANNRNDNVVGCVFPSSYPYGSVVGFQNSNTDNSVNITNQFFDSIRIWITDVNGVAVNLQGVDTVFQFLLE